MIIRKSTREIEKIAGAGALVAETIAHVGGLLVPGVTTDELDAAAGTFIREHGGIPTSEAARISGLISTAKVSRPPSSAMSRFMASIS